MNGVDYALNKCPFVDGSRMAAAGGFLRRVHGGTGSRRTTDGFKAIVSHASVYDKVAMYATEELWFEEHDMQGTPWSNPESLQEVGPGDLRGGVGKIQNADAGDRRRA